MSMTSELSSDPFGVHDRLPTSEQGRVMTGGVLVIEIPPKRCSRCGDPITDIPAIGVGRRPFCRRHRSIPTSGSITTPDARRLTPARPGRRQYGPAFPAGRVEDTLPWAELESYIQRPNRPLLRHEEHGIRGFARRAGFDPSSISSWKRKGEVPFASAERLADNLGMHPSEIWPTYTDVVLRRVERDRLRKQAHKMAARRAN